MDKITIQIEKPDIDLDSFADKRKAVKEIAELLAVEIIASLEEQKQNETIQYWHNKIVEWRIEDAKTDIRRKQLEKRNEH